MNFGGIIPWRDRGSICLILGRKVSRKHKRLKKCDLKIERFKSKREKDMGKQSKIGGKKDRR